MRVASTGHVDWSRWGGQDPAGAGSRSTDWRTNSPMGFGFSNWRRSAIPLRFPMRWPRSLGITQQPGMTMSRVGGGRSRGRVRLADLRQLRARSRRCGRSGRRHPAVSATVRILATSREGLGVTDEQLWPLRSLERTRRPSCSPTEHRMRVARGVRSAVEEVCRRLDGIPLAIELAASRMESMTGDRSPRSSRSSVQTAGRLPSGLGTPSDTASGRRMVLRSSRRIGKGIAGTVFRIRRRIRCSKRQRHSRIRR